MEQKKLEARTFLMMNWKVHQTPMLNYCLKKVGVIGVREFASVRLIQHTLLLHRLQRFIIVSYVLLPFAIVLCLCSLSFFRFIMQYNGIIKD